MSGKFDETSTAIIGRLGELAASELLRSDGASTISLCRIDDGGAPMLQSEARSDHKVLPDLQVFNWKHAAGCLFFETKTFDRPAENKGNRCWVHGVPVRLFNHYVACEQKTGIPVHLAINELSTGELRISDKPLSELPKLPCQCRGGCGSVEAARHTAQARGISEMQWYFDREDLPIVYKHSDKTIMNLRREHAIRISGRSAPRAHHRPAPDGVFSTFDDPCGRCGKLTADMFRVGPLDQSGGFRMCGPCYRSGLPAEAATGRRS